VLRGRRLVCFCSHGSRSDQSPPNTCEQRGRTRVSHQGGRADDLNTTAAVECLEGAKWEVLASGLIYKM
jgi:hypothetical protein